MRKNNAFTHAASAVALAAGFYCCAAEVLIQRALTPEAAAITPLASILGGITLPGLLLMGLYHILLLVRALRGLAAGQLSFVHSCFIVCVALSGITLLSDVTLLSDIGKEYRLTDVRGQWWLLYAFTGFHIAVMAYGWRYLARNRPLPGKTAEGRGWDALFASVHHVGLICGALGILGLLFSLTGLFVAERFLPLWTAFLAALAIVPLALMGAYWWFRNRRRPLRGKLDEKQAADSLAGAAVGLISVAAFACAACIAVLAGLSGPSAVFWLCAVLFVGLAAYSAAVTARNRIERE
jgi:hypothetical protein